MSVLQSVNGDQDQAIDTLLGMSDPDYVTQLPPPQQQQQEPTQTELDEQLARRLMLEEEQAAQHQWSPPQQQIQGYQSYQSGRAATRGGGNEAGAYGNTAQRGNVQQRDTMTEFQDGFNKIAESMHLQPLISRVVIADVNRQLERRHFLQLSQRLRRRCRSMTRGVGNLGSYLHLFCVPTVLRL